MLILEIGLADLVYMTSVLSVCPSYALFLEYLYGQRNTCKIEQAQNISFWSSIFLDVRLDLMSAMYTGGGSVKHVNMLS